MKMRSRSNDTCPSWPKYDEPSLLW